MKPMKWNLLSSLISLFAGQTARSQDSLPAPKTYNAIIKYQPEGFYKKGLFKEYFVAIGDSSLDVSGKKMPVNFASADLNLLQRIDYRSLESAKIYQRNKNALTILLCAVAGAGVGALIVQAGGNDSGLFALDAADKAIIGALIGGGAGSLVGLAIAKGQEKNFLINGQWKSFEEMKEWMIKEN
jgi:hypothetical protein